MGLKIVLGALCVTLLASGCSGDDAALVAFGQVRSKERPDLESIRHLEDNVKMPARSDIGDYARYYWVSPIDVPQSLRTCEVSNLPVRKGHFLRGVFVLAEKGHSYRAGIHTNNIPKYAICDGGCNVIDVALDLESGNIVETSCHARG